MRTKTVKTIGLAFGIVGVVFIFIWGPPQPQLEPGVFLEVADGTPIDKSGKTVAKFNKEVQHRRRIHEVMSQLGLIFIIVGFGFQLWGTWLPDKPHDADAPDSRDSDTDQEVSLERDSHNKSIKTDP